MPHSQSIAQPRGMYILALTEVFERIGYYTLTFTLVLYASASAAKGGLGWSNANALSLAGSFTLLAYALPIFGGFIADRILGVFPAAIYGALIIIVGYIFLLLSSSVHIKLFYIALACIAGGTALFKPCMPTLLGMLYAPTDTRRNAGFNYYYMGINVGSFVAGVSAGTLAMVYSYRVCLASAGLGMVIGLLVLILGRRFLVRDSIKKSPHQKNSIHHNSHQVLSAAARKALILLTLSFIFYAVWAFIYNITLSGTLSIYIENYTIRNIGSYQIPTTYLLALEGLGIVIFTPILAFILNKKALKNKSIHFFTLMNAAIVVIAIDMIFFAYMTYKANAGFVEGTKPFYHYQMMILILLVSISEILISPVMMSAISLLAPNRYRTMLQAFYLLVIGLTGKLAASVGSLSLTNPFKVFLTIAIVSVIAALIYAILRKSMVKVAVLAAREKEAENKLNYQTV